MMNPFETTRFETMLFEMHNFAASSCMVENVDLSCQGLIVEVFVLGVVDLAGLVGAGGGEFSIAMRNR
jgi:hypothetical protein